MMTRGISAQDISVVYNPVSIKTIIVPPPERDKPAVFLYVGRLKFEGQKRVKDLFDGLARTTGNGSYILLVMAQILKSARPIVGSLVLSSV